MFMLRNPILASISKAQLKSSTRLFTTNKRLLQSPAKGQEILVKQRAARPISPHLTIYEPQITWYLSSLHRVSGVMLGAIFFGVTIGYGINKIYNFGLNDDSLVEFYKNNVPDWLDYTAKGSVAYLFTFHFANGIRHLVWDMGKGFTIKGIYAGGYAVLGVCAVAGTYLFGKGF